MKNHIADLLSRTPVDLKTRLVIEPAEDVYKPDTSKAVSRPKGLSWGAPPLPIEDGLRPLKLWAFGDMKALYRYDKETVVCRCVCGTYELRKPEWIGRAANGGDVDIKLMACAECVAKRQLSTPERPGRQDAGEWRKRLRAEDFARKAKGRVIRFR